MPCGRLLSRRLSSNQSVTDRSAARQRTYATLRVMCSMLHVTRLVLAENLHLHTCAAAFYKARQQLLEKNAASAK